MQRLRQLFPIRAITGLHVLVLPNSHTTSAHNSLFGFSYRFISSKQSHPLKIGLGNSNTNSNSTLLSEAQFHDVADHAFETLITLLTPLDSELDDADISYSQGVLNVNLGAKGFWVINKQTPNRQLWWSSPLSGPRRYEYRPNCASPKDAVAHEGPEPEALAAWRGTSDGKDMLTLLQSEMLQATGINIIRSSPP